MITTPVLPVTSGTCGSTASPSVVYSSVMPDTNSSEVVRDADAALSAFKRLINNPLIWVLLVLLVLVSFARKGK